MTHISHTRSAFTLSPRQICLLILLVLQIVMLLAFLFEKPPHPPLTIPLFAMGPFLGASLALGFAALFAAQERLAQPLGLAAMICAMISFGPHKLLDPLLPQIWPTILLAQGTSLFLLVGSFRYYRKDGA
ncbi:MAG: hypothetical protein N4A65_09835 [Cohaesibacter sp.]|nr:hypothetical protein [Cohaesibacter sp.]